MSIEFTRPFVLLAIPAVVVLLVLSARFMYIKSKQQKITYIVVRALVATLLILALSGVRFKLKDKFSATIFVVDASDSVKNSRQDMIRFINNALSDKKSTDAVGIVVFGENAAIEQLISVTPSFSEIQSNITKTSTNIESALTTALSMIPEGYAGRIVLLTDGIENQGSLKKTIASVITKKCLIEVKNYEADDSEEVYVSNLVVPPHVGIGENFIVRVEIESNVATNAIVSLYAGRTLKEHRSISLQPGKNDFVFKDTQTSEGLATYRVIVEAEEDTLSVNNEYLAYADIAANKPILIVEGKSGQSLEYVKILDSLGLNYEVVLPGMVPNTLSTLNEFSAVVFVDVYAKDLRTGFLDNLESFVRDFGGGFVATGGKNSYALGGYKGTAIEQILPVNMEPQGVNEIPSIGMMMVIDKSGSMSAGNGVKNNLEIAKEAARSAVDNLRDSDYAGVISFDDSFSRVVPLQSAQNRYDINNGISSIQIEGGTSIYPALEAAAHDISGCAAKVKHILLLTDGEDFYEGYNKVIDYINENGITLSTIAVGEGCNSQLLQQLAESCGGRYYYTDANSDIPRIFAQEVFLSVNSYIVEEDFVPGIVSSNDLIRNVVAGGLPELHGYIATSAKPRATQLFVSKSDEPVLAVWQYGLGKTVAFTTDVSNKWTSDYAGWENYQELWHNLLQYVTSADYSSGVYAEVEQNGDTATVNFFSEDFNSKTEVSATVVNDKGESQEITLDPISPGVYKSSFRMTDNGVYSINIKQYNDGTVTAAVNTAAIMQYSLEYRFYDRSTTLSDFVKTVGGNMIEASNEVFNEQLDLVKKQKDLATPLLIAAAVLFVFDIFIRRFRIDFVGKLVAATEKKRAGKAVAKQEKKAGTDLRKTRRIKEETAFESAAAKEEIAGQKETAGKQDSSKKENSKKGNSGKSQKDNSPERLNTSELLKRLNR